MNNKEKIMYLRDKNGVPCVTIAFGSHKDACASDGKIEEHEFHFDYAVQCVGVDAWNREIGRKKAIGRLNSFERDFKIVLSKKVSSNKVFSNKEIMIAIVESVVKADPQVFPTRMRQGAKNRLKASAQKS